jgi:hypothetical protein
VLDVAVRGFGDVAALTVGGDAVFGLQQAGHGARAGLAQGTVSSPVRAAFSRSRSWPVAISRGGPGALMLSSEQYPASARNKLISD